MVIDYDIPSEQMTPEQIHLNSCMYEPLVDMSIQSLKRLYEDVRAWNVTL